MAEVMPEDRIARLMTIRDLVSAGQQAPARPALPTTRCATTTPGQPTRSSRKRPAHRIRQTMPIQSRLPGGRGYRIKGDPLAAIINGQRVDFGVDGAAKPAATKENLSLMAAQQGIQSGALDIQEKQRAAQMGKRPSLLPGMRGLKMARGPCRFLGLRMSLPLTEGQGKAAAFGLRSEEADKIINSIGRDGAVQPGK